jgi:predicted glutamine amidotransferase
VLIEKIIMCLNIKCKTAFLVGALILILILTYSGSLVPDLTLSIPPDGGSELIKAHNCRLYAAISPALPDSVLLKNLVLDPSSLKELASWFNTDGWGIAWYPELGVQPVLRRGALRAYNDTVFDSTVRSIDTAACRIILAHVRHCTVGCCCPECDSIADPHPFWRQKNGMNWTFIHNGSIPKAILQTLIGHQYLAQNPPSGSRVPECDPSDSSNVTDSELFFLLILKHIEQNNWQATEGIIDALTELVSHNVSASLNFILSDGYQLWAFRKSNTLYSFYDSLDGYTAVASEIPNLSQANWHSVDEYGLLHVLPGARPVNLNLRAFMPPIVTCPGDTSLLYILSRPVCLMGFGAYDPDGNLDSVYVNRGSYQSGKVCFNLSEGVNEIILNATDHYGNRVSCSTVVNATLSDPGYVAGVVTDSSHLPIQFAIAAINDISDTTDINGNYFIPDLVPGIYQMKFSSVGFMDTTITNLAIVANDTVTINAELRAGCQYLPGDANGSGTLSGSDVVYSVNFLKGLGPAPPFRCNCPVWGRIYSAADANGSCSFSGLDITFTVNHLKRNGPLPRGCPNCPPTP